MVKRFCSAGLGHSKTVGDIESKLNREEELGEGNGIERCMFDKLDGLVESSGGSAFGMK